MKKTTGFYCVGATGHRNLGDQATIQFVSQAFQNILAQVHQKYSPGVIALCGLAQGSDTLFAQAALAQRIPLQAVIAYTGFEEDFPSEEARQRYHYLLAQCEVVHKLPFHKRSDEAYLAVGHWLVDHSDLLLAAWNGQPAAGMGGTGDVVDYALHVGRPVKHLHTRDHTITLLQTS